MRGLSFWLFPLVIVLSLFTLAVRDFNRWWRGIDLPTEPTDTLGFGLPITVLIACIMTIIIVCVGAWLIWRTFIHPLFSLTPVF